MGFTDVYSVHVWADDDFSDGDDIGVLRDEEGVDFAQGGDGESVFLFLHLQTFEGHDLLRLALHCAVHDPVGALFHFVQQLNEKEIEIEIKL